MTIGLGGNVGGGTTIGNTVTGGTANRILYIDASGNLADSANLTFGPTAGQGLTLAAGTATTDVNAQSWTQTWNAAGVTFTGLKFTLTATAYAANSKIFEFVAGENSIRSQITGSTHDLYVDGPSSGTARILLRGNGAGSNHQIVSQSAAALKFDSYTGGLDFHISGVPKLTIGTDGNSLFGGAVPSGVTYNRLAIKHVGTSVTAAVGASVTATNLIPAKANVLGVNTVVTTALGNSTGTTGYTVGDGSDVDRWGSVTGITAGTDTDGNDATADPTGWFTAANNVVLTALTGNFDGTGVIYIDVAYTISEAD